MQFNLVNPDSSSVDLQTTIPVRNIEGMLYYQQIPPSFIENLNIEISALNLDTAIQWQDKSGLHRQTFEFGISFKEIEQNGSILKNDMPPFLIETRKELVKLFEEQLSEKDPEKYEHSDDLF